MKRLTWQVILGIFLVLSSSILYLIHFVIFRDAHHIFLYLIGDIAFVPIEVLLVTLVLHHLLSAREKRAKLEKLNMIVGAFFSEIGIKLLTLFSDFDPKLEEIRKNLIVSQSWSDPQFADVHRRLRKYDYHVDIQMNDLQNLKSLLIGERDFLLRLLENPNLLEHETFTQLLWGIFHLLEELVQREDFSSLPKEDYEHLANDIKRAYVLLSQQWLDYMKHLKGNYPYLFSLAMRTNPFDQNASPIIQSAVKA
jgi:hypothetical protein